MKRLYILVFVFLEIFYSLSYSTPDWIKVMETTDWPRSLENIDSNNVVIYMRGYSSHFLYKSTNGGLNWEFVDSLDDKYAGGLSYMSSKDITTLFIICNNVWEDGKYTKNKKILRLDSSGKKISLTKLINPLDTLVDELTSIKMKDSLFGIIESYHGIYITKDGWKTHEYKYVDNYYTMLSDISIISEKDFSISTGYGYFYRTTDEGETFRKVKVGNSIQKIQQINDSIIYLGCSTQLTTAPTTGNTLIYKSIDSGNTWILIKELDQFIYKFYVEGFKMLDNNIGMLNIGTEILLQTKDGWNTYSVDTITKIPKNDYVDFTQIEYAGNRPLVALSKFGLWTFIDTLYENLQRPVLIAPMNNSLGLTNEQNLTWKKVSDNNKYILQLSFDSLFSTLIIDDTLTISLQDEKPNVINKVNSLQSCKLYYWRVASIKGETAKWSETWTFQTLIETPKLQYPKNNTEITMDTLEFRWQLAKNAERYLCQVSLDSLFESLIYSQDTLRINKLTLSDLPKEKQLYWRARTYCSKSYGNWSNIFNFKIKDLSSIEDNGYSDKIIISPNPATDYISINLSSIDPTLKRGVEGEVAVEIYDVMGVKIHSTPLETHTSTTLSNRFSSLQQRIDISNLSPGVYFVKIVGSNGACSIVEKFVKM